MGLLSQQKKDEILELLATDKGYLGKLYKKRKTSYEEETIEKFDLEIYKQKNFYEVPSRLKKLVKVRKDKDHSVAFENKCWSMMYDLGFRILNKNHKLVLPYGPNMGESQQIDVLAVNDDVAIIIECKSSEEITKVDHRPYIDSLGKKIAGFTQTIKELFGERRVKFMFATNNQNLGPTNIDILNKANAYYLNNTNQDYLTSLIEHYKGSAHYQFMAMLFKGEIIRKDKLKIPAIKGKMGGNNYYLFSIEPDILLRLSFVMHRVKANEPNFPTYQRLLDNKRIKSLSEFINEGGYFPNSVILNFDTEGVKNNRKLEWLGASNKDDSISEHGILKIPYSFAIAWIIDGQHRVYGYSYTESLFKTKQTIPVVAFENLSKEKQLEMFMDINQNQKAISRNLKETLKEELFWESKKPKLKIEAVKSGINNFMGASQQYKISEYLTIGEDEKEISMSAIIDGLGASGFLPKVEKSEMIDQPGNIYKIGAQDQSAEMTRVKKNLGEFLCLCFDHVIDNYPEVWGEKKGLIRSVRGSYSFVRTLGELNTYLHKQGITSKEMTPKNRFNEVTRYIDNLLQGLSETQKDEIKLNNVKKAYGAGNAKIWNNLFTGILNKSFNDFITPDYIVFLETQNNEIQDDANKLIDKIESIIKSRTIHYIENKYGKDWGKSNFYDLFSKLRTNAELEEKNYEKTMGEKRSFDWKEMFHILDYLKIWKDGWGVELEEKNIKKLSEVLSLDITKELVDDQGKKYFKCGKDTSFKNGEKWLKKFNTIRNNSKHFGSRATGINKSELSYLNMVYNGLNSI